VKDRNHASPGTKVLGIGGDLDHRVRARPHQQVVDLAFVLVRDVCDGLGQCEDEVEIPHGQQLCFARRQPSLRRTRLTLWAMAVAARIVGDVFMRAVSAARNMPPKRRRAAALDGAHHFQLCQADMTRVCRTPSRTMGAENVRDLQYWTRHGGLYRSAFALLALGPVQVIQRAVYRCYHPGRNTCIARRGRQLGMAQQRLDHPDIHTTLQQMGGKGMA